jgi:hypothetical protein
LVLDKETGFAIGIIQAGSSKESYAISWNNIIERLNELSINPFAQDALPVAASKSQQISTSNKVSKLSMSTKKTRFAESLSINNNEQLEQLVNFAKIRTADENDEEVDITELIKLFPSRNIVSSQRLFYSIF